MKKKFFLTTIFFFISMVLYAQANEGFYKKYLERGFYHLSKGNFFTALEIFDLAYSFSSNGNQKKLINNQRDYCREKIFNQQDSLRKTIEKTTTLISFYGFSDFNNRSWAYNVTKERFALINDSGELLTDFLYTKPSDFDGDFSIVFKEKGYVLLDKSGKEMGESLDFLIKLNNDNYFFSKGNKNQFGVINSTLKEEYYFDEKNILFLDTLIIKSDNKFGFVVTNGEVIIEPIYNQLKRLNDKLFFALSENKWELINLKGEKITSEVYDEVKSVSNNLIAVKKNNLWEVINLEGNSIITDKFFHISNFNKGVARFDKSNSFVREGWNQYKYSGKWGLLNNTGKKLVSGKYGYITDFYDNDIAWVRNEDDFQNSKWGLIDFKGNELTEIKYTLEYKDIINKDVLKNSENLFRVNIGGKVVDEYVYDLNKVDGGKWGFINKDGKEVIPFIYNYANSFNEGLASVELNEKYGVIDKSGKLVIDTNYFYIGHFREGRANVFTDDFMWGFIDKKGKKISEFTYNSVYPFNEGFAGVAVGGFGLGKKWGFIDKNGIEITPIKYDSIDFFYENYAQVNIGGKWGVIDKNGIEITPIKYDEIRSFYNDIARVRIGERWGYINSYGKEFIPLIYSYVGVIKDSLIRVNLGGNVDRFGKILGGKWGFLNQEGKEIIPIKYDEAFEFYEGVSLIKLKNKWSFLSKSNQEYDLLQSGKIENAKINNSEISNNNLKIPDVDYRKIYLHKYDSIDKFSSGLARVKLNGKWGFIDTSGSELVPLKYDALDNFYLGLARVKLNEKWGFIDINGEEIISIEYSYAELTRDSLIKVNKGGRKYKNKDRKKSNRKFYIFREGKEIMPYAYWYKYHFSKKGRLSKVSLLNDTILIGGKWGYLDINGKIVIPIKYDYLGEFSEDIVSANLDGKVDKYGFFLGGKWGGLSLKNEIVIPFRYDDIFYFNEGFAKVKLKKKWGFIDKNGNEITPIMYDYVEDFKNQHAIVGFGLDFEWRDGSINSYGKLGLINHLGKEITELKYDTINNSDKRFAIVKLENEWGFVDKKDIKKSKIGYDDILGYFNGKSFVKKENYWFFLNLISETKSKIKYSYVLPFRDSLAKVSVGSISTGNLKWGLIDENGKEVCQLKYDFINDFNGAYAKVNIGGSVDYKDESIEGGSWGIINKKGKELIPPTFDNVYFVNNDFMKIMHGNKYGGFSIKGNILIPPIYEDIKIIQNQNLIAAKLDGKWGFINSSGKTVIKFLFDEVENFIGNYSYVSRFGYWYHINKQGEMVFIPKPKSIKGYNHN